MRRPFFVVIPTWLALLGVTAYLGAAGSQQAGPAPSAPVPVTAQAPGAPATQPSSQRALLNRYCVSCHNERMKANYAGLALDTLDVANVGENPVVWEKVVRKLRAGVMPPAGRQRPDEAANDAFVGWLQTELDRAGVAHPNPGRTETFHRLNRTEYQNAIRDLLAVDINAADFLPADDSSYGFDNIAGVLKISQSLLERYLAAAKTISRLAVGTPLPAVDSDTYRVAADLQQHDRIDDLPFGTRGGMLIKHLFPQDGEYEFKIDITGGNAVRDTHQLEVTIDGEQVKLFSLSPRQARGPVADAYQDQSKLEVRVPVGAGPREVGVAFYRKPPDLIEQVREPFQNPRISGNDGGPGGSMPYVASVTVVGPYNQNGAGDTPSRRRIFVCRPGHRNERSGAAPEASARAEDEQQCARTIIATLARRAYRGMMSDADVQELLAFYQQGRAEGGNFEAGIELALRRMLVSPEFLFRVEADPAGSAARAVGVSTGATPRPAGGTVVYRIGDVELASRLSFFIWSSIPDDELLDAARQGKLKDPATLERQVRRMLADPRSEALTKNFAAQWLLLRNVDTVRPGDPYSLTFDESLRNGLKQETELFIDSIVRENRGALELLTANYTFVNERVALHYGIPNVQGSHFRRITLPEDSPRRGILGHGSILTLTSHAIRTSPVIRGKWILNNILGTPPPDPPPNVPALVDRRTQAKVQTMRERMSQHRANPTCASCHSLIDPAGFALENFDAIGRWRIVDESFNAIDASGVLPDGTKFNGVTELRNGLVRRPERFVTTLAEKLLTYALGRGLEYYDMPSVRKIVSESAANGYQFQSIVLGVVKSYPFQMRRFDPPARLEAN